MKKKRSNSKLSAHILSMSVLALSSTAYAQIASDNSEIEEIEVTGIRASLEAAADLKRNDDRIVDAIVAEDIGKLPDNNIAEALQRITGVSINSDFGVGEKVSIRGMEENRVELNGRSTLGDDRDGISLDDFPSSFLKSVEVIKTPTADMIEGALGGVVSMETIRPLDLVDPLISISIDTEQADKTENVAPMFNAAYGDNWDLGDAGTFGAILNVSYQDRELRRDQMFNRVRLYDEDVNGLSANTPSGRFAVREQNTVEQKVENRERTAFNASFQWSPASEKGRFYLDLNATERSGSQEANSILDVGGSRTYNANTTQDSNGQVENYSLTGAFVIPKTWSEFRETESSSNAFGGEWEFTDKLRVSGEVAVASSESFNPATEFNLRPISHTNWDIWADQYVPGVSSFNSDRGAFDLRHTVDVAMTQSGENIPSVVYSDAGALTNPENLAVRAFYHDLETTKNDETAVRFDVEYDEPISGFSFIKSVKAGVRTTENDYKFNLSRYRADNLYRYAVTGEGTSDEAPHAVWIDQFEAMFPGSITTVNHHNSFDQSGNSGQNDLLSYSVYDPAQLANAENTFQQLQQAFAGTNFATTGSLSDNMAVQEGAYRDITEETSAFYLQSHLDFGALRAVVGARYVETDIQSSVYVDGELVTGTHSYDDVLPSLNVTYDVSEDTMVRFAAAKVMRRADYNELSPAFEIENSLYDAERGAIDLDPFRATQFDLSVEHYFENGSASIAYFYKDIESFLDNNNTCVADSVSTGQNVTEWENICQLNTAGVDNSDIVTSTLSDFAGAADPDQAGFDYLAGLRDSGLTGLNTNQIVNGQNGEVSGIELGVQYSFSSLPGAWSGLGINANYTYADSENPNGNTLTNISENTLNAQVYWEWDAFQVRIAYNYRDRFLDTEEETRVANVGALALNSNTNDTNSSSFDPTAGNSYIEERGQLDLSASWDVTDNVTLVANVTNALGEPVVYSTELGSNWKYSESDRRMTLGVRANF
jgi:TonB-dependent receptor